MRYIVTVNAESFTGQFLLKQGNDGLNYGMPAIDCESVEMDHHYFLRAVRGPLETASGRKLQSIHIPYQDVLSVTEYAKDEKPVGFLPPGSRAGG